MIVTKKRTGNIIIQSPGGTAAQNANTYKITLPNAWVKAMGFTKDMREAELYFDGTTISISKKAEMTAFVDACRAAKDRAFLLYYYAGESLSTKIAANFTKRTLCVENYTEYFLHTAFGRSSTPTWDNFETFLEERCIPRARSGLREYLETHGLDRYDPLEIIKKTGGRMAEDDHFIRIEEIL